MPTIATSHFVLDLPTLFAVTVFLSATGGVLLLFAWLQNRRTPALAFWGIGYMFGASAAALLASPNQFGELWTAGIANALVCGAYGMMWGGARAFEGRRVHASLLAAGSAVWLLAFQFPAFAQSLEARVMLVSAITAGYALLSAYELWYARDRELISRWPTLALVATQAAFLLGRIPFAHALVISMASGEPHGVVVIVMAFQMLFTTFCLPFLRVAMSKERAELEQRRAALTDSLTGIANRRAFFERGGQLLDRAINGRRVAALLLFDLDRFKEVNDTAGHQAGDRVLQVFCTMVGAALRPEDLFGRLGGEEFACLLADASMTQAIQIAERLRREFEGLRLPEVEVDVTVSVGVAMAGDVGRDLNSLLAMADRALYRAKAEGRNRVACSPLVLVDKSAGESARRAVGPSSALAAPIARA